MVTGARRCPASQKRKHLGGLHIPGVGEGPIISRCPHRAVWAEHHKARYATGSEIDVFCRKTKIVVELSDIDSDDVIMLYQERLDSRRVKHDVQDSAVRTPVSAEVHENLFVVDCCPAERGTDVGGGVPGRVEVTRDERTRRRDRFVGRLRWRGRFPGAA